ncbi:chlorophyll a/b-binding protein domain-containing protein [Ochromonadaceae sp. CCMP2298]|nr:chlorophyll a/b-binding protein domain-containing protein [Ochromonadaceae sp. CCMP2298]
MQERSQALPFDPVPAYLDGTLPGDRGFDPAGFTNQLPKPWLIGGEGRSLKWYREAELVHSRVAMLAIVGMLAPSFYHFDGNPEVGVPMDAFSELNPFKALTTVPADGLWQITLVIFGVELARIKRIIRGEKEPGDLGLGQTGFNPFGFEYTEEQYFEKQVQEIKHGRLAMFGILGMLLQASASGQGIVQQLGGSFTWPDERAVMSGPGYLGDYFPPGL